MMQVSARDVVLRFLGWLTAGRMLSILSGAVVGAAWFLFYVRGPARPILRDLAITVIADKLAGNEMPLRLCDATYAAGRSDCDLVYTRSEAIDEATQWGQVTNSPYLTDLARQIIPYYVQEGVTDSLSFGSMIIEPSIPVSIAFVPLIDDNAFHLLGQTNGFQVILNERYLTFSAWNDERGILSTLVHEMIHDQGGNFLFPPSAEWDLGSRSVWVEQHTQSATTEILASMCRMGERVACRAFWMSVGDAARGSYFTELSRAHLGWLYHPTMDLLTRSRTESIRAEKNDRYWRNLPGGIAQRDAIIAKYQRGPWTNYILPGVVYGIPEEAGTDCLVQVGNVIGRTSCIVPFDDTALMFGSFGRFFLWATTIGGDVGTPNSDIHGGYVGPRFQFGPQAEPPVLAR